MADDHARCGRDVVAGHGQLRNGGADEGRSSSSTGAASTLPVQGAGSATVKRQFTAACYLASKPVLSALRTNEPSPGPEATLGPARLTWCHRRSVGQAPAQPPL